MSKRQNPTQAGANRLSEHARTVSAAAETSDPLADLLAQWKALLPEGHDASDTETALRGLPVELARERVMQAVSRLSARGR